MCLKMGKTKKINITVCTHESLEKVLEKLKSMGVTVLNHSYVVVWKRYDILTEMNREQAIDLLDYLPSVKGIMWKGES